MADILYIDSYLELLTLYSYYYYPFKLLLEPISISKLLLLLEFSDELLVIKDLLVNFYPALLNEFNLVFFFSSISKSYKKKKKNI
jgi:hypothetical protein